MWLNAQREITLVNEKVQCELIKYILLSQTRSFIRGYRRISDKIILFFNQFGYYKITSKKKKSKR